MPLGEGQRLVRKSGSIGGVLVLHLIERIVGVEVDHVMTLGSLPPEIDVVQGAMIGSKCREVRMRVEGSSSDLRIGISAFAKPPIRPYRLARSCQSS